MRRGVREQELIVAESQQTRQCRFDGIGDVAPSLVWEKLAALRAGADLATGVLF